MFGEYFWLFGLKFDTFSFFIYFAFLSAGAFFYWYSEKIGVGFWQFVLIFLIVAILAPVGASALSALEFHRPFISIINRDSGSTFLGGYILALLLILVAARLLKVKALKVLDAVTLSWIIGYGVGRFACFFSGDGDYGTPTSSFLGMAFPHGIIPTTVPVWPTPLFESGYCLILFVMFYYLHVRKNAPPSLPGRIFFGASSWMLLCRFAVEYIRLNPKYAGFSLSQWICMPLIVGYSAGNIWLDKWPSFFHLIFPRKLGIENSSLVSEPPVQAVS